MDESTWYTKQRSQLEESLWQLKQRSRILQDCRSQSQKNWRDDAATAINQRFLNPHADDSEKSLAALTQQLSSLTESDRHFQQAAQLILEANKLSEEIEQLIEFCHQDMARGHSEYNNFQDRNAAAQSELPSIAQLIDRANSCCPN